MSFFLSILFISVSVASDRYDTSRPLNSLEIPFEDFFSQFLAHEREETILAAFVGSSRICAICKYVIFSSIDSSSIANSTL